MTKSAFFASLFLAMALQVLHAETMVCPLNEIVADTNPDRMIGNQSTLRIKLEPEDSAEGQTMLGDLNILGLISRDEYMKLYGLSLLATKNDASQVLRFSILLKYDGPSKENGFEGPKGTDKYIILAGSGLDQAMGIALLTSEAFKILRPYGITTVRLWNTSQELEAITKAVDEKKLKRGQPIGMNIPFVCWKEK